MEMDAVPGDPRFYARSPPRSVLRSDMETRLDELIAVAISPLRSYGVGNGTACRAAIPSAGIGDRQAIFRRISITEATGWSKFEDWEPLGGRTKSYEQTLPPRSRPGEVPRHVLQVTSSRR